MNKTLKMIAPNHYIIVDDAKTYNAYLKGRGSGRDVDEK